MSLRYNFHGAVIIHSQETTTITARFSAGQVFYTDMMQFYASYTYLIKTALFEASKEVFVFWYMFFSVKKIKLALTLFLCIATFFHWGKKHCSVQYCVASISRVLDQNGDIPFWCRTLDIAGIVVSMQSMYTCVWCNQCLLYYQICFYTAWFWQVYSQYNLCGFDMGVMLWCIFDLCVINTIFPVSWLFFGPSVWQFLLFVEILIIAIGWCKVSVAIVFFFCIPSLICGVHHFWWGFWSVTVFDRYEYYMDLCKLSCYSSSHIPS